VDEVMAKAIGAGVECLGEAMVWVWESGWILSLAF